MSLYRNIRADRYKDIGPVTACACAVTIWTLLGRAQSIFLLKLVQRLERRQTETHRQTQKDIQIETQTDRDRQRERSRDTER